MILLQMTLHFLKVSYYYPTYSFYLFHTLTDLDIDITKIKHKFVAILTQRGFKENDIAQYNDMAGPILVAVLFGAALLLKGRVEFGNIYGFGLTGCIGIYFMINLMSRRD